VRTFIAVLRHSYRSMRFIMNEIASDFHRDSRVIEIQEAGNGDRPALTSSQGPLDLACYIYTARPSRCTLVLNYAYAPLFRRACVINRPISISRVATRSISLSLSLSSRAVSSVIKSLRRRCAFLENAWHFIYTITARAETINARGPSARRNDSQTRDIEALFERNRIRRD